MTYLREKTVCFTGHRPEKLPGYGETENASLNVIRSMLYYQIYQSAEEGYKYFISGLARGVDLWADDYKSGTGQTINYARKQGLKINIINVNNYILKKNERKKGLFYLD